MSWNIQRKARPTTLAHEHAGTAPCQSSLPSTRDGDGRSFALATFPQSDKTDTLVGVKGGRMKRGRQEQIVQRKNWGEIKWRDDEYAAPRTAAAHTHTHTGSPGFPLGQAESSSWCMCMYHITTVCGSMVEWPKLRSTWGDSDFDSYVGNCFSLRTFRFTYGLQDWFEIENQGSTVLHIRTVGRKQHTEDHQVLNRWPSCCQANALTNLPLLR